MRFNTFTKRDCLNLFGVRLSLFFSTQLEKIKIFVLVLLLLPFALYTYAATRTTQVIGNSYGTMKFNRHGLPDTTVWNYERSFMRNYEEYQW